MLGKLTKYEFKSTARIFLPIYLVLLFFSLLGHFSMNGLISSLDGGGQFSNIVTGLVMFGYIMAIFSVIIITLVVIIQRFYKNLTGEEGYLMHTLPVSAHSLIASKVIVSMVWELCSAFMVVLSVIILAFQPHLLGDMADFFWELAQVIQFGFQQLGLGLYANIFIGILAILASFAAGPLMIYASISIGHTFKTHRVLGSVGAYMGLTMFCQMIVGFVSTLIFTTQYSFFSMELSTPQAINGLMTGVLLFSLAGELVFSAAWYFITHYVLTHQLNLE